MLDKEDYQKLTAMGALNYNINTIMDVLDLDKEERINFQSVFKNANSRERQAYDKGVKQFTFQIHLGLLNQAKKGNTAAIKKLEKIQKASIY